MGIHSGPVSEVTDVSGRTNITGGGINMAQRVMDCGDAGHILVSKHAAEDLEQYDQWQPYLHDLGECEIKHGERLHVVNFYNHEIGNSAMPDKLRAVGTVETFDAAALRRAGAVLAKRASDGETLIFSGTVSSSEGAPLAGAVLDVWQANGAGEYSFIHPGVPEFNLRGQLVSDANGRFQFETVVPSPYEIPVAGATGGNVIIAARSAPIRSLGAQPNARRCR